MNRTPVDPKPALRLPSFGQALTVALILGVFVNIAFLVMKPPPETGFPAPAPNASLLALLFATALLPWMTYTLRMMNWLNFLGHPLGFRGTLRVAVGAEVSAVFGPSTFTSSGAKACLLLEQSTPAPVVLSLMSLIALEDFLFVLICLPASLFLSCPPDLRARMASHLPSLPGSRDPWGALAWGLLLIAILIALILWVRSSPLGVARRTREGARDVMRIGGKVLQGGKGRLALNMLLTLAQWACRYTFVTLIAMAFGLAVNVPLFFLLHWLVYTGANVTPTPGSAGGAEAAFYFFFGMVLPAHLLPWAAVGWRFFSFYYPVVVGSIVLSFLALKPRPSTDPPASSCPIPPLGPPVQGTATR